MNEQEWELKPEDNPFPETVLAMVYVDKETELKNIPSELHRAFNRGAKVANKRMVEWLNGLCNEHYEVVTYPSMQRRRIDCLDCMEALRKEEVEDVKEG